MLSMNEEIEYNNDNVKILFKTKEYIKKEYKTRYIESISNTIDLVFYKKSDSYFILKSLLIKFYKVR
jgi:hypothetical protein